ncbi:MAG: thermonuclease family protein [Kiritimatiellae bacterium]|nr:thermonuclease family protein [Kiritimatiellia bacterium]
MIRAGLAWHYKRFDSTPAYAAAENEARQNRRGLWSDHNPIPPEQCRHGRAGAPRTPSAATQTAAPSNEITLPASRVEYRAGNAMPVGSRTPAPVCVKWPHHSLLRKCSEYSEFKV